jgi:hypothetical protein
MAGMKLRLAGAEVRLRLSRLEAARFGAGERIEERTPVGLAYSLHGIPGLAGGSVRFEDGEIAFRIPLEQAAPWSRSEAEGLYYQDGEVAIAVEKDYECTPGSDPEAFPNPRAQC